MLNDIWGSINNPHDFFQQVLFIELVFAMYLITKPKFKNLKNRGNSNGKN